MKYVALFVRKDSIYKKLENWDAWDAKRDACNYHGPLPCVAHPPCRAWGRLSHMSFRSHENPEEAREAERSLALVAASKVLTYGGILEHPSGSRLFGTVLSDVDTPYHRNGFTIEIDQYDFGHVAHKKTKLFFKGLSPDQLPELPPVRTEPTDRSICGNVPGTTRCTQYQREYTPPALIEYFEKVLDIIGENA